jgi:hypothetical protein
LIKQFTFTEPSLIVAVVARKNAGVDVRVILNAQPRRADRRRIQCRLERPRLGLRRL